MAGVRPAQQTLAEPAAQVEEVAIGAAQATVLKAALTAQTVTPTKVCKQQRAVIPAAQVKAQALMSLATHRLRFIPVAEAAEQLTITQVPRRKAEQEAEATAALIRVYTRQREWLIPAAEAEEAVMAITATLPAQAEVA